jgi:hypothetical protein
MMMKTNRLGILRKDKSLIRKKTILKNLVLNPETGFLRRKKEKDKREKTFDQILNTLVEKED